MKFEFDGRWLRLSVELFPQQKVKERIDYPSSRTEAIVRRKLLRRLRLELGPRSARQRSFLQPG